MLTDDFIARYTGNHHPEAECAFIDGSHMALHLNRELLDCVVGDLLAEECTFHSQRSSAESRLSLKLTRSRIP